MKRLRVSAISYLNTAPLMWDFEHGMAASEFDVSYTVPSQCALQLSQGAADIGIIPAAAYATVPNLVVLPGVAIASRGKVKSILLVSKLRVQEINSVALDNSSLASVALLKILFAKWWDRSVTFTSMPPDLDAMLEKHDSGLLIGDPALKVDRSRYFAYDLSEEWVRHTRKPFVFAFWGVRQQALAEVASTLDLAAVFQQSRDHGLQPKNLSLIAREWAPRLGLSESEVSRYLTSNIHYHLDSDCLEGLQLFYRYAAECGALPKIPNIRFLDVAESSVTE